MRSTAPYPAIAIVGPTASGKSDLGLFLAQAFGGEIVNYDSIQLYRGVDIGTAKPSLEERGRAPHHLVDILDPGVTFSAGEYQERARAVLEEIRGRRRRPILVGGTGLYLRAVLEGLFDGPRRSESRRERLGRIAAARGREHLHRLLVRLDPASAAAIAPRDTPKIVRALEVRLETGRALSEHLAREGRRPIEGFAFHLVGLAPDRAALYARIDGRVRRMFERGLVEEVRRLLAAGVPPEASCFRAIGYRHVLAFLHGFIGLEEAIISTGQDTRRYAKRQLTWFRRQHAAVWFEGFGDAPDVQARVHQFVRHALTAGESEV